MRFRFIGALEAEHDGRPVDLGSPKQRAVLAALLLEAGRVVPAERLVEQVWGDDPPPSVEASLQAYVSNLRRALRCWTPQPVVRQARGYRMDLGEAGLDLADVRRLAARAHTAADRGDWTATVDAAQRANELCRGALLPELADEYWVRTASVEYDELRTACRADLVTGLLGVGAPDRALAVARNLHEQAPLSERACWLTVLALHRAGRSTEALEVCRGFVRHLDDELGLEAGPALRDLQSAVLRHDPELARWPIAAVAGPAPTTAAAEPPMATPAQPLPRPVDRQPIVGRRAELAVLDGLLDEVVEGSRWLLLTGPAGMGKTRLAEAALDRASARGWQVARASCPDDDGAPAWWPIAELVRALGGDAAQVLRATPGEHADSVRFAVYERVRAVIESSAAERPVVLLLDDVHWADAGSLGLLGHLAAHLTRVPVAVVLTARDGVVRDELGRLVEAVARSAGNRRIAVPPLADADIGELMQQVTREPVDADEAVRIGIRTGGNPFFVGEYARLPLADRREGRVPLAVRAVVDRRLAALRDEVLDVVRIAAVIGDPVDVGLLERVAGLDVDELAERLDDAVTADVLAIAHNRRGYTFAHGLLRDAVLAGIADGRRRRMHARVAAAITDGSSVDAPGRRATHLVAALPLGDPTDALRACRSVAEDADGRQQADAAAHWWQVALGVLDDFGLESVAVRDEIVRRRLWSLIRAGRGQTVYDVIVEELTRARAEDRPAAVGPLCSVLLRSAGAWPWVGVGSDPGPLFAMLHDTRIRVSHDAAAHARVLAALAVGSCYEADATAPDRLSREAIELAETSGDPDALADALLARVLAFAGIAQRVVESDELLGRLAALSHAHADVDAVTAHSLLAIVRLAQGDAQEAGRHCAAGAAASDRHRLPTSRVQFRLIESSLASWAGRVDEAEQLFADALRLRERTELFLGWQRLAQVVSRWRTGRLADLVGRAEDAGSAANAGSAASPDEDEPGTEPMADICLAVARGDVRMADRLIGSWLEREGPPIWSSAGCWTLLAHQVADARLSAHARPLLDRLRPLAGLVGIVGMVSPVGPVSLAIARLEALLGDTEAARRSLAAAEQLLARRDSGAVRRQWHAVVVELGVSTAA